MSSLRGYAINSFLSPFNKPQLINVLKSLISADREPSKWITYPEIASKDTICFSFQMVQALVKAPNAPNRRLRDIGGL